MARCKAVTPIGRRCSKDTINDRMPICAQHHMHGYLRLVDDEKIAISNEQAERAKRVRGE